MKNKMILGACVLLGTVCSADVFLMDTFNAADSLDINTNLASRQSGTVAPVSWSDTVNNDWHTQIYYNRMRMYANGLTVSAMLDKDFTEESSDVRVEVSVKNASQEGFSVISLGMGAEETSPILGYSFWLDTRAATKKVRFFENGALKSEMDVTSIIEDAFNTFSIDFTGGNTVSATFNGTPVSFVGSALTYTGTTEAENYVMLSWYGVAGANRAAEFEGVSVSSVPEPVTAGLFAFASLGLMLIRRIGF